MSTIKFGAFDAAPDTAAPAPAAPRARTRSRRARTETPVEAPAPAVEAGAAVTEFPDDEAPLPLWKRVLGKTWHVITRVASEAKTLGSLALIAAGGLADQFDLVD